MNNKIRKNKITKFKTKKIDFGTYQAYSYRDFIIMNDVQFYNTPAVWVVKMQNNKEVYSNGNSTKRECMEWIDGYYQDMNDFLNSSQFIND